MNRVSIVIPVYNGEKYIQETLESVLGQTYADREVIVVDDGSTDGTLEILSTYGDKLRVFRQENRGAAAARNKGIQEATGKWVAFVDADDVWLPEKLEKQLAACGDYVWSHTTSLFSGGVNNGKRDCDFTPKFSGAVLEKLVKGNFITTSTVVVERKVLLALGGFDVSLRSIQDWDLWVRIASENDLGYLGEELTIYRVHPASASRSTRKTLPNHLKVIERMFDKGGAAESLPHLKHAALSTSCSTCSYIAEEEGDYWFALKCAFLMVRYQPFSAGSWRRALTLIIKYIYFSLTLRAKAFSLHSTKQK